MYVIVGATGNTGKDITLGLLAAGKKVRIVCRNQDKAQELVEKGAEMYNGDVTDVDFLASAFVGATALYSLIPTNYTAADVRKQQNAIADALITALQGSSVQHIVVLSSVGAHLPEGTGVVQGLYDVEQKFNTLQGRHVLFLRPTYFMENLYASIGTIKQMGKIITSLQGDKKFPMVATKDIAAVALKRLLALDFTGVGNVHTILGERDISYNEVSHIISNTLGIPVQYLQVSGEEAKQGMMRVGLSESIADGLVELESSINSGWQLNDVQRTPETTTPTSMETFAQHFVAVYQHS